MACDEKSPFSSGINKTRIKSFLKRIVDICFVFIYSIGFPQKNSGRRGICGTTENLCIILAILLATYFYLYQVLTYFSLMKKKNINNKKICLKICTKAGVNLNINEVITVLKDSTESLSTAVWGRQVQSIMVQWKKLCLSLLGPT